MSRHQLTLLELAALRWVGEQYAARLDVIQAVLGRSPYGPLPDVQNDLLSESATLRFLETWSDARLIRTKQFLPCEAVWIWLTQQGIHETNLLFRYFAPRKETLTKLHTINWLRWYAENTFDRLNWRSRRNLMLDDAKGILPDAIVLKPQPSQSGTTSDVSIAFIAQISNSSAERLAAKLQHFSISYDEIWIAIDSLANPKLSSALDRAINQSNLRSTISVYDIRADRFPHFAR